MTPDQELHHRLEERAVLFGCGVESASPAVAELAGMIGYDVVWLDLEHGSITWREAENFCRAAKAGGAWPLLRISGFEREHVLHALEAGARLVVVPMIETPEQAATVVRHGKYPPDGRRGFAGSTRGLAYGLGDRRASMVRANRETHLFVQIETPEAVRRCAEIVSVEGVTGGLVGPGDLSVTMGKPLDFDDPEVIAAFTDAIRAIRATGKVAATAAGHPGLMRAAIDAGVQILVCDSEMNGLRRQFESTLQEVRQMAVGRKSGG